MIRTILQNTNALSSLDQFIVIDSSKISESEEIVALFREQLPVQFVKADPSATLPEKRNAAIKFLTGEAEVVFFLDDDVELDPTFFENSLVSFENPKIIGVGGRDINKSLKTPKRWQIFFNLTSAQQGVILSSGQNVEYANSEKDLEVEWISGCVMSFRTSLLKQIKFDENRHFDGEDVDFTFRASKFGILVCSPNAKYQHSSSLNSLPNKNHRIRDLIAHRCLLALNTDGKVRFLPTFVSILVLGLAMFVKGLSKRDSSLIYLGVRHLVLGMLSPIYVLYLLTKKRISD
jgi:GT2 family glycosyltransferase